MHHWIKSSGLSSIMDVHSTIVPLYYGSVQICQRQKKSFHNRNTCIQGCFLTALDREKLTLPIHFQRFLLMSSLCSLSCFVVRKVVAVNGDFWCSLRIRGNYRRVLKLFLDLISPLNMSNRKVLFNNYWKVFSGESAGLWVGNHTSSWPQGSFTFLPVVAGPLNLHHLV